MTVYKFFCLCALVKVSLAQGWCKEEEQWGSIKREESFSWRKSNYSQARSSSIFGADDLVDSDDDVPSREQSYFFVNTDNAQADSSGSIGEREILSGFGDQPPKENPYTFTNVREEKNAGVQVFEPDDSSRPPSVAETVVGNGESEEGESKNNTPVFFSQNKVVVEKVENESASTMTSKSDYSSEDWMSELADIAPQVSENSMAEPLLKRSNALRLEEFHSS